MNHNHCRRGNNTGSVQYCNTCDNVLSRKKFRGLVHSVIEVNYACGNIQLGLVV